MGLVLRGGLLIALLSPLADAKPRSIVQDGFENPCDVDADQDRLVNCHEMALLTDRFDADTDSDGLSDGDEVLGTRFALDLPSLGVSPLRRDILLEIDWVDDNEGCQFHSHRPTPLDIAQAQAVFAQIPIENPDGSTGINLIIDAGQGSLLSGGTPVHAQNGYVSLAQLQSVMQPAHFAANRRGYFRYSIHAHRLGPGVDFGGVAGGDTHLVTLRCRISTPGYVRNAILHELGHNLGLHHGGGDDCNEKPNYNSVMNYAFSYRGVDVDCDRLPDGVDNIGFSRGDRRPLIKAALVEADGVCPAGHPAAKPVDWNANGMIDAAPVSVALVCPEFAVLEDWDDAGQMRLPLYAFPNAEEPPPVLPGQECPLPPLPGEDP